MSENLTINRADSEQSPNAELSPGDFVVIIKNILREEFPRDVDDLDAQFNLEQIESITENTVGHLYGVLIGWFVGHGRDIDDANKALYEHGVDVDTQTNNVIGWRKD